MELSDRDRKYIEVQQQRAVATQRRWLLYRRPDTGDIVARGSHHPDFSQWTYLGLVQPNGTVNLIEEKKR